MDHKISNVRFEQINSFVKGYKEVRVLFLLDGKEETYFIFTKSNNPIKEAKKIFNRDLKSGLVVKAIKRTPRTLHPILITGCAILGAAVIALSSVLIYKAVNDNVQPELAPRYLNNPIKITNYQDDVLISETTIKYDEQWYALERTINSYDKNGSKIMNTTVEKITYDEQHRAVEGEATTTYADRDEVRKNVFKSVFESNYKGNEYNANYINDELEAYTYDEYESTFTDDGEKYVDDGVDIRYFPSTEQKAFEKTRHSESFTDKSGYNSTSIATATAREYEDDGTLIEERRLYNESKREFDEKNLKDNIWRFSKTEIIGGETNIEVLTGFEQLNENKLPILTEIRYFEDEEATILVKGTKTITYYDYLNRPITNLVYELVIPEDATNDSNDTWIITDLSNTTYYKDSKKASDRYSEEYRNGKVFITNSNHSDYDEYIRVTHSESTSTNNKGKTRKSSIDYEYGDPVPLDPSRDDLY